MWFVSNRTLFHIEWPGYEEHNQWNRNRRVTLGNALMLIEPSRVFSAGIFSINWNGYFTHSETEFEGQDDLA